jgi:hypothetical protein
MKACDRKEASIRLLFPPPLTCLIVSVNFENIRFTGPLGRVKADLDSEAAALYVDIGSVIASVEVTRFRQSDHEFAKVPTDYFWYLNILLA